MRTCTNPSNFCPAQDATVAAAIAAGVVTTADAAKKGLCAQCLDVVMAQDPTAPFPPTGAFERDI